MAPGVPHSTFARVSYEIDLARLFAMLVDARWFIVGVTGLFTTLGVGVALLSTPIYKSDALIQIESKGGSGVTAVVGEMNPFFEHESSVTTEIELIKSRMVLGETVDKFNLTTVVRADHFPLIGKGLARLNGNTPVASVSFFETPASVQGQPHTLVVTNLNLGTYELWFDDTLRLSGQVGTSVEMNGYRMVVDQLSAQEGDSFTVNQITQMSAINQLSSQLTVSEKGSKTGVVLLTLTGELPLLNQDILADVVQNYYLQNVNRSAAEAEKSLAFLNDYLPQIRDGLNKYEQVLNQYRQVNESVDLNYEAQSTLQVMIDLEAQLNELAFKESDISQKFTRDHPTYKSLLEKRKALLQEQERLNSQVQKMPKTQREILRMTRDVEVTQHIYTLVLNKIQELSVVRAGTVGNVRIIDQAQRHDAPIKPKKSLIVVLAMLLGGMLSTAVVLVMNAFHQGMTSEEELESRGLICYATVPNAKPKKRYSRAVTPWQLLAVEQPADLAIEALRGLRTSLHFLMSEASNNVLMLTSATAGVGKTFIATNLAVVAAHAGQRVLLIDADMRRGRVHEAFGFEKINGLADFLLGHWSDVIQPTKVANVDVVVRGTTPRQPSELLLSQLFAEFIHEAKAIYDLIIIDTPPVLAVTDANVVGTYAGTTLLLARFKQSTSKEMEVAFSSLNRTGVKVRGCVFNGLNDRNHYYDYESDGQVI